VLVDPDALRVDGGRYVYVCPHGKSCVSEGEAIHVCDQCAHDLVVEAAWESRVS
jgi:hypothetical protein